MSQEYPKRSPALTDTDPMPFGKYKGTLMQDVPPDYLAWLWNQHCSHIEVSNYIYNSIDALNMELSEEKQIVR